MNNIKNIILDLGGVLINLDYHKTNDKLSELGIPNGFTKAKQITIFDELEEGKISDIDFSTSTEKPWEIISAAQINSRTEWLIFTRFFL